MIATALTDLWHGFGVALEPHNLWWCFVGVLVGNMVGVLPGMGPLATISILLPLTFGMKPVGAILMLAGVMYGAQYGGAICSILLNLPCHPPHAVPCLDGFPMTKQGRGGVALGLTVIASFVGASWGITEMIFLSPLLVRAALQFGPAEVCSLMLLGLLAGSTLARGSPLKGVAMTVLGLFLGSVGTDLETGSERYTFGLTELDDGIELIALARRILNALGIGERVVLELNTLGDPGSRIAYREALVAYFTERVTELSEDSRRRLERNPLRILDSKEEGDQIVVRDAPLFGDYLNSESRDFYDQVRVGLDRLGINFRQNLRLVRGLDYYTHTAFEFVTTDLGAQGTVMGGGRYDGLVELMGGPALPGPACRRRRRHLLLGLHRAQAHVRL